MRRLAFALLSVTTIGCGGSWTIVKQANPSPFTPDSTFAVAQAAWAPDLKVGKKNEADWLAEKDSNAKQSHENDKLAFGQELSATVMTQAKGLKMAAEGAQFTIKPTVYWMEPGYYIGISAAPAEVKVRVDIVDASGNAVDTIETGGQGAATEPFNPIPRATVGERLRKAAGEVAERITQYVRERAGVKK
jgi:hypothetical protein